MRLRRNKSGGLTISLTPLETRKMVTGKATDGRFTLSTITSTQFAPTSLKKRYSKTDIAAGRGWRCQAGCQRLLQTYERSLEHVTSNAELKERGHIAK